MNNVVRDILSQHAVYHCFAQDSFEFSLVQTNLCRNFSIGGTTFKRDCLEDLEVVDTLLGSIVYSLGSRF